MMNFLRNERGAAALEAALVLPLYLAFIFAIIEFGNIYWTFNDIQFVADEMSRCNAVGSCTAGNTGAKAFNSVANIWQTATAATNEITVTSNSPCGTSSGVGTRVKIVHPISLVTGYFTPQPFNFVSWPFTQLAVQSCYPK